MNPLPRSADLRDFNPNHVSEVRRLLAADIRASYDAKRIGRWRRWRLLRELRRATTLRIAAAADRRRRRRLSRGARRRRRANEPPGTPRRRQDRLDQHQQDRQQDQRWQDRRMDQQQDQQPDWQDQRWQDRRPDWLDRQQQPMEPGLLLMIVQLLRQILDRLSGAGADAATDRWAPGGPRPGAWSPPAQDREPAWLADPGARFERRYTNPYDSQNADKARIIEYMIAGLDGLRDLHRSWGDAAFPLTTAIRENPRLTAERPSDPARDTTVRPRSGDGERSPAAQSRAGLDQTRETGETRQTGETGETRRAGPVSTPPSPVLGGRSPSVADMAAARVSGHDSQPARFDVSPPTSPLLAPVQQNAPRRSGPK